MSKQVVPKIVIDPEFKGMMMPLTDHQRDQLEESLRREGCRDALVLWKGKDILLDGYNRYEICTAFKFPFTVREIELADREAARAWIRQNQLGRRNLTPEGLSYIRGQHYNEEKQAQGGAHTSEGDGTKADQKQTEAGGEKTEDVLAAFYKVAAKTIRNDASFAKALDAIVVNGHEQFKIAVLKREVKITRGQVKKLGKMDATIQEKIVTEIMTSGAWPKKKVTRKATSITLPRDPKAFAKKLLARGADYVQKVQEALAKALEAEAKKG